MWNQSEAIKLWPMITRHEHLSYFVAIETTTSIRPDSTQSPFHTASFLSYTYVKSFTLLTMHSSINLLVLSASRGERRRIILPYDCIINKCQEYKTKRTMYVEGKGHTRIGLYIYPNRLIDHWYRSIGIISQDDGEKHSNGILELMLRCSLIGIIIIWG